jgi:hypothetical protein
MSWTGDGATGGRLERVTVSVAQAYRDGLWNDTTTIALHAGWYNREAGSGDATLRVILDDVTAIKQVSPGRAQGCACSSAGVGTVIVRAIANGTSREGAWFFYGLGNTPPAASAQSSLSTIVDALLLSKTGPSLG